MLQNIFDTLLGVTHPPPPQSNYQAFLKCSHFPNTNSHVQIATDIISN